MSNWKKYNGKFETHEAAITFEKCVKKIFPNAWSQFNGRGDVSVIIPTTGGISDDIIMTNFARRCAGRVSSTETVS